MIKEKNRFRFNTNEPSWAHMWWINLHYKEFVIEVSKWWNSQQKLMLLLEKIQLFNSLNITLSIAVNN